MPTELKTSIGQYSDKGRKEINQDFHGALFPTGTDLQMKGIAIALCDGISSSKVSQIAAESTVKSFLTDYYCTSETWTVKTAGQRVIDATNSWLYSQTRRSQYGHDMDSGYVCTLCALVLKADSAHLFHVGDGRIHRVLGDSLEPLTTDHRIVLSADENYLSRAMGMAQDVEIDYRKIRLHPGDIFVLTTDGVHEYMDAQFVVETIRGHAQDLDLAAREIVAHAFDRGSVDNLTIQIVRIDAVPDGAAENILDASREISPPPLLDARQEFEGYRIVREIHANSRSHIYLAIDIETGAQLALKIPSIDLREDRDYLNRFVMEGWIAQRLNNAHVLAAAPQIRPHKFIYTTTEYVEGQTLAQWMRDNPNPELAVVRGIIEQIAKGLRAFHRKEMLHQDLRPENIMIDREGTVKIIDFGSTKVPGVIEARPDMQDEDMLGTLQYAAPEYFIGEPSTRRADYFSLGVIAYQMLTGKLPYGTQVSKIRTKAHLRKLRYLTASGSGNSIPQWVDTVLEKAVHPDPYKRYAALSEFLSDLGQANEAFYRQKPVPLLQRNPVAVWQVTSAILVLVVLYQMFLLWQ